MSREKKKKAVFKDFENSKFRLKSGNAPIILTGQAELAIKNGARLNLEVGWVKL